MEIKKIKMWFSNLVNNKPYVELSLLQEMKKKGVVLLW